MVSWIDLAAVLLILTNLWLLGTSRLAVGTRAVAVQAVLLVQSAC